MNDEMGPKVALVTGAARRIGAAIAADLASLGWTVAVHCNRSRADADELVRSIVSAGGRAAVVAGDLTRSSHISAVMDETVDRLGPPTLLVNNASIFEMDELTTLEVDFFDDNFAVHVRAPILLSQALANNLPAGHTGNIVNIVDQRVLKLTPKFFSYTLSKATLWTATKTMAQALAPRVRVNAIGPGPTLASERQTSADFDKQASATLLGHGPDVSEFAKTIEWIVDTSSLTGQLIALDGGQHLAWETPDVIGFAE